MTLADVTRFRGRGTCLAPLWLQSMIGHPPGALEMAKVADIDPLTKILEAK